jgi:hypothetical protein
MPDPLVFDLKPLGSDGMPACRRALYNANEVVYIP